MRRSTTLVLLLCACGLCRAVDPPGLFPFVLPWDDDSAGITNVSNWLDKPAGKHGPVRADQHGDLWVGDQPIRFFGTDQSHNANFPFKPDAEKIARRMAKFGINIVRFHIMDIDHYPRALLRQGTEASGEFEPEALDRLDYYIAQLEQNGIYIDLNLLNYRPFTAADGLPQEIEQFGRPYSGRAIAGFMGNQKHLELQRDYARRLLTHYNPYTKRTYAEDPAVAFVEICNENGLIHAWIKGTVDAYPEVFLKPFQQRWNDWLKQRYGTTAQLQEAWSGGAQPVSDQDLIAQTFGLDAWQLQNNHGAESTLTLSNAVPAALKQQQTDAKSVVVEVTKLGTVPWFVLLNRPGFSVQQGRAYTLSYWARSDAPRKLPFRLCQVSAPFHTVASPPTSGLTPDWQHFEYVVTSSATEPEARVMIGDFGTALGTVEIAGMSLRPGGIDGLPAGEKLDDGSAHLLTLDLYDRRTAAARADWLAFLWECDHDYWQGMYRFLKDELKVQAQVIGTAEQYVTPNLMAETDCIDAHAYWQHPVWPNKRWDRNDWFVRNLSMADAAGGLLPPLALRRVLGKPFAVTEYGSPSPNTHSGEGPLLVGAYAALQDWNFICISRYTLQAGLPYTWGSGAFRGYFDVDQHPTKMLGFIPAVAMFTREDVQTAQQQVVLPLDQAREMAELQRRATPWQVLDMTQLGVPPETSLVHRVAVATEGMTIPQDAVPPDPKLSKQPAWTSDTGQLVWDHAEEKHGVVTINTPRSKAVIGYGGGRTFDLGGVVIQPGPTLQDGWSTITLTAMQGDLTKAPASLLVTATGNVQNTGMVWTDEDHNSVGRNWGTGPTLVEGIPATLTLPYPAASVTAWALDERGQRREKLTLQAADAGRTILRIGPESRTLWYEVQISKP